MAQKVSPAHIALGHAVRQLREQQGISQERLAELASLHRNYVGGIERGERNPTYGNMIKLSKAVGVQTSRLVELAEELTPQSG